MLELTETTSVDCTTNSTATTSGNSSRVRSSPRMVGRMKISGRRSPIIRSPKRTGESVGKQVSPRSGSDRISNNEESKGLIKEKVQNSIHSSSDCEEDSFEDHNELSQRVAKSMYFANKLPTTPRPSLPLTALAVDAFTKGSFAPKDDSLEFLDLEMAAEIGRNACVSPTALIMALVYMERLSNQNPGYLSAAKPSELFVVSLLVASKFIQDDGEDVGIWNDEWATSAKMDLKRVNKLELQFLTAIDWTVNVGRDEYDRVLQNVEGKLALSQGLDRGWFTYSEIGSLSKTLLTWSMMWPTLYEYVIKVFSAASMAYTTLIATVVTSSILAPHIFMLSKSLLSVNSISLLTSSSLRQCGQPVLPSALSSNKSMNLMETPYEDNVFANGLFMDENETDIHSNLERSISTRFANTNCQLPDEKLLFPKLNRPPFNHRMDLYEKAFEDLPLYHHKEIPFLHHEEQESAFVNNLLHMLTPTKGQCRDYFDWKAKDDNKQYLSLNRLSFPLKT